MNPVCVHFDAEVLDLKRCESCEGETRLKLFVCTVYKQCTLVKKLPGVACCNDPESPCPRYEARL